MAKGFTPIIGLAVVVALAMVAVFGAIGPTNPAFAAFDSPASNQLDEQGFHPVTEVGEVGDMDIHVDQEDTEIDLAGFFKERASSALNAVPVITVGDATYSATSSETDVVSADIGSGDDSRKLTLTIPGTPEFGTSTITVTGTQVQTVPTITDDNMAAMCIDEGGVRSNGTSPAPSGGDCLFTAMQVFDATVIPTMASQVSAATFAAVSDEPGKNTRYDLAFRTTRSVNTLTDELIIELADFGFPSSVSRSSVAISVDDSATEESEDHDFVPDDVTVSGEKLNITIGDMDPDDAMQDYEISADSVVEVTIRQSADISNPSEAGGVGPVIDLGKAVALDFAMENDDGDAVYESLTLDIPFVVKLDEDDGGRGDTLVAKGLGFKNGTSLTFWLENLDADGMRDGKKTLNEEPLCTDDKVSDNIGTCEFTVTNPPFDPGEGDDEAGVNFVNAVDGNGKSAEVGKDHQFLLKPSISVTPDSGSPGETMLIQMQDFDNTTINSVKLAGVDVCTPGACSTTITIPNSAELGSQRLTVGANNGQSATKNVIIGGPTVNVTPSELKPNQRVSLNGTGFTPNSWIRTITIGGDEFDGFARDNTDNSVKVDNSGTWSTSAVLPVVASTVSEGSRTIRVTDSDNRTGTVDVTIPARVVTIDPPMGRIGTHTTIRGENFPTQNDDGDPVNISITYDSASPITVSAVPNTSGSFAADLRIPTSATPGDTNTVKVTFSYGPSNDRTPVITTVTHDVPAGTVSLSQESGPPGSTVKITGLGFRTFVPVNKVTVGGLEVTPSPKPPTDALGNFEFDILIPGLGDGIQTIEVTVGGGNIATTASVGYTVTTSGVAAGNNTPVADAVTALGENFVRSFHFNNDTKMWTFYDPEAGDASTQENFIAGETYWILVMENADGVILNNTTRNLTCVAGNCWNQIVW